jgi:two-component system phosphate regulon sensor histidine kinase PhoR
MANKIFTKTFKFARYTAGAITVFLTITFGIFSYYLKGFDLWFLLVFAIICYSVSFYIIQFRVERFIYKHIKKIYDNVSLLEATSLQPEQITTDMATLTKEIERFTHTKKLEIETLKVRENYRREFIGNISHELKTPLFTVQGYILTLLEGNIKDQAIQKKYLNRASKGVERLIYIVKDLDMITKLESGDLHLDKTNFNIIELINNVYDLLEFRSAKKNITLTLENDLDEPIMVYADRDKIQQVLSNLIVNSIKYGKNFGTTEIGVESLVRNKIIVRVTDNGEGIEKHHIPRLFERFYRVDKSGSRKEGGSGLGLSIVKHIIEAHEEKIYIESQIGVGSEFSFTLEKSK